MFTLKIHTINAAFTGGDKYAEIARILRDAASRVEYEERDGQCRDVNGNHVGEWRLT